MLLFISILIVVVIFVLLLLWRNIRKVSQERQQLGAIVSSMGEGLIASDSEGRVVIMNQAAGALLKIAPKEFIGKEICTIFRLTKASNGKKMPDDWLKKNVINKQDIVHINLEDDYNCEHGENKSFPVALTVAPLIQNKTIGAIIIFRNITREKEIDRAKTEFVSLAAHQLRTPLNAIKWYSEVLLMGKMGPTTKDQKEYLEALHESNQRMVFLVNALLNVSRLDLGTIAVNPEKIKLSNIAENALKELQKNITEKKLNIIKNYSQSMPVIQADPKLIQIIFQNLLSNSVKYTPEKGAITIDIKKQKNRAQITVSDTGIGIPKKDQNKIFTKLFRADNVKTKDTEGNGLGLYIVKSVVDRSGGTLRFESKEGKGTTFFIEIPLKGMKKKKGVTVT